MSQCSNPNCFVHDGEKCCMGEMSPSDCLCWNKSASDAMVDAPENYINPSRVPWSSAALGSSDLVRLYQQGPSILIGLLGAENTGKTTFLAANYSLLLTGHFYDVAGFCGSQTLGAWESIAANTRFTSNNTPSFPPHTPRGLERTPGILHLALKDVKNTVKNIFFTDSPGEWFTRWAIDPDAVDAKGAKWTTSHSDAFFIFADCEKLSSSERGAARRELRAIIERLGESVGKRPVTLIWAKSDINPKEQIKSAIQEALLRNIPHAKEVEVTVNSAKTMLIAVDDLLQKAWSPLNSIHLVEPILQNNPFFAYRGHNEHA
ncbi:TRAFAC clade GTPase domain-containing protein [Pectobacterium brasiliense]|uniref:TRAFAC clade GTPase domain-containing protein n=1 Tax=Pectobacterium brasiliense TaxID=180957 RepID=UPI003EBEFD9A